MQVHLINPSHISFGVAVITPRWLYVLAGATGERWGTPRITDETLDPIVDTDIQQGDVVGIGIHTGNALRGYEVGRVARARGAWVVFGGIHATLFPDEPFEHGGGRGTGRELAAAPAESTTASATRQAARRGRFTAPAPPRPRPASYRRRAGAAGTSRSFRSASAR